MISTKSNHNWLHDQLCKFYFFYPIIQLWSDGRQAALAEIQYDECQLTPADEAGVELLQREEFPAKALYDGLPHRDKSGGSFPHDQYYLYLAILTVYWGVLLAHASQGTKYMALTYMLLTS